jgi:hypothetical protein
MIARISASRADRASTKSVNALTDSERLRITRFVARLGHEDADTGAWCLEVFGFGSAAPLARQYFGMPARESTRPAALDELLASLSLVRWGPCTADADGTRVEGCCVQDFAPTPQPTLAARHAAEAA